MCRYRFFQIDTISIYFLQNIGDIDISAISILILLCASISECHWDFRQQAYIIGCTEAQHISSILRSNDQATLVFPDTKTGRKFCNSFASLRYNIKVQHAEIARKLLTTSTYMHALHAPSEFSPSSSPREMRFSPLCQALAVICVQRLSSQLQRTYVHWTHSLLVLPGMCAPIAINWENICCEQTTRANCQLEQTLLEQTLLMLQLCRLWSLQGAVELALSRSVITFCHVGSRPKLSYHRAHSITQRSPDSELQKFQTLDNTLQSQSQTDRVRRSRTNYRPTSSVALLPFYLIVTSQRCYVVTNTST